MGGLAAASQVLGSSGFLRIMAAVGRKSNARAAPLSPERRRVRLVAKTALTPSIWRLEFELDAPLRFAPGQYLKLKVAPYEWRDYSIASASDTKLTLLISARTRGDGSLWVETVSPGETTEIEAPFGAFRLEANTHKKVFVATGTGAAPFQAMFEAMEKGGDLDNAELYFGCRTPAEDVTAGFPCRPPHTVVCASRAPAPEGGVGGRVTQALARLAFDPAQTDFYLCGSAAMVADCRDLLQQSGAQRILTEPY